MKKRLLVVSTLFFILMASCKKNTAISTVTTSPVLQPTLAATMQPTDTPDPMIKARDDALLYSQNFESGSTDGLYDWGQGNWKIVVDATGNHVYCNATSDNHSLVHFGVETWENYAVEMKFKFMFVGPFATAEIRARMNKQTDDYYSGALDYRNQGAVLFSNPSMDMMSFMTLFSSTARRWYTLRLEVTGSTIKFFIDNQLFKQLTNTDSPNGKPGFDISPTTQACVDDIRVWALTKDGQIAQLPAKPAPISLSNRLASHKFPKLYYSNADNDPDSAYLTSAFYYDILSFTKEVSKSEWAFLGPTGIIRSQNPNAVILATHSIQEYFPQKDQSVTGKDFISGLKPDWIMQDIHGKPYPIFYYGNGYWSSMINLSTDVNTYIPQFLNKEIMNTGLFDGIYYDGTNENWWQVDRSDNPPSGPIDFNQDRKPDTTAQLTAAMDAGVQKLLSETRRVFPSDSLIAGNGGWDGSLLLDKNVKTDTVLANLLNGREVEGFLGWEKYGIGWLKSMRAYYLMQQVSVEPKTPFIAAYCTGTDYNHLRYVLSSALMFDGYFTCTNATGSNLSNPSNANWWYDEYSVDLSTGKAVQSLDAKGYLGLPVTDAYNVDDQTETLATLLTNNDPKAEQLTWRRDFQNGIVLVNPSGNSRTIDLKGAYRKILGVHDPKFNDGSAIMEVTLFPQSGIILLKP